MKFDAITIKDIARALGLSPSSVSRALRDSYEISEDTKKRVRDYAEANNYQPNPVALSLKDKKTGSIGVIVSEIANAYFSQVIDGIESIAYTNSYNVIITQSKESTAREGMVLEYLKSRSVDGLIVSVAAETTDPAPFKKLIDRKFPIVFFDRIIEELNTHTVKVDNFAGAYEATRHLLETGYKRIAVVANNKNLSITTGRIAGFLKALEESNVKADPKLIKYCQLGGMIASEVENALISIFDKSNKPDAILALSDKISIETLRFLHKNNVRIPEEIGLIGFSNSPETGLLDPPMSVIRQPAFEMGKIAASHLLEQINSKQSVYSFENITLAPEIIIRKSSCRN
jgi:LacI family transcriptional regulator